MTTPLGHPALISILVDRIEKEGPISFADFMDSALYDANFGYYSSVVKLGEKGDYWTSPEVHPVFARLLARQLLQAAEAIASNGACTIIEMGAGNGTLAGHLLNHYREEHPDFVARLRYIIVERSPRLTEVQQKYLLPLLEKGMQIRWLSDLGQVSSNSVTGIVFSNELVDAFPVHRVVHRPLGLREIFVGWSATDSGRFIEIEAPPFSPALAEHFERLGIHLEDGQRAEVNLHALEWMRQIGRCLSKGIVVTIDYGHTAADLFSLVRRAGTLLCYYQQTASDSPYVRVGQQDMTAHVDFTSLALAGQQAGLHVTGFTNQLHFLMGLGIEAAFQDLDPESADSRWMRELLRPEGMGTTYKILVQHKGMPPPRLDGLRSSPFFPGALYTGLPAVEGLSPTGTARSH